MAGTLTWLGHSGFRLDSPGGKRIYIDPWFDNPKCPEAEKQVERADVVALSHGHSDHAGTVGPLLKDHGAALFASYELTAYLSRETGVELDMPGLNTGGSREIGGIRFTLTDARHSSSADDFTYLGPSGGIVMRLEDGFTVYYTGDTCAFMSMQLIGRLYEPDIVVLPIGDYFTMGPREAALALELIGAKRCVPCHWGTFPLLTGTPAELAAAAPGVTVELVEPGEQLAL